MGTTELVMTVCVHRYNQQPIIYYYYYTCSFDPFFILKLLIGFKMRAGQVLNLRGQAKIEFLI